jgi:putative ABC transport system permease protein
MFTDLRYAIRMLIKAPAFTIIAVVALALGIGANTAIFSVVDAVLLRPLPYPHSEQLVLLRERVLGLFDTGSVSYPNYLDWRASQQTLTDLALVRTESVNLSSQMQDTPPERVNAGRVTANFLTIMQIPLILGRNFTEAEDVPNGPRVALISEGLWQRRFGGAKDVIGKKLIIDTVPREIIGVAPEKLKVIHKTDVYLPFSDLRAKKNVLQRGNHPGFTAIGRLTPGVTLEQARADFDNIARNLEKRYPDDNTGRRINVRTLLEAIAGDYRASLNLLLIAVLCVLLIACANVANLQLARALSRGKELAVRAAMGASRWRLVRLFLIESTVLAGAGAVAGLVIAIWSFDAIHILSPTDAFRFQETRLDIPTLGFTAAIAMVCGILVGIWPAWRVSRLASLSGVLHEAGTRSGSDSTGRQRARGALVITQVALALVLLAGAGLTLKSFWRSLTAPLGFEPAGVLTMTLSLPEARYDSKQKVAAFYKQLIERIETLPGVAAAAVGQNVPFDDTEWDSSYHIAGTPPAPPGHEPSAEVNVITNDYFKVLKMPILRGRGFGPEETLGHPRSVIVDDLFVRKNFPNENPIGRQIDDNQTLDKNPPPLTIVGVVPHVRSDVPGDKFDLLNLPQMYFSQAQMPETENSLLIRTSLAEPMSLASAVVKEVQAIDPDQPVDSISTMQRNISQSLATRRLTMILLGSFAALALVLASVGLYGVMALSVTQRTREFGIRLALGAPREDVFKLALGRGLLLVGIGLALGLLGALGAGQALTSLLYNVGGFDPTALVTAIGALAGVALLACWFPARRATRVDPIVALRYE